MLTGLPLGPPYPNINPSQDCTDSPTMGMERTFIRDNNVHFDLIRILTIVVTRARLHKGSNYTAVESLARDF